MRYVLTLLFLVFFTHAASAQDPIYVRAGEHPNFSRLVIQIAPDAQWEFRTSGRRAVLSLPAAGSEFSTDDVFDRIPKTRILSLRSDTSGDEAILTLALGCACTARATTQGNLLIIDVEDETAATLEFAAQPPPTDREDAARTTLPPPRPASSPLGQTQPVETGPDAPDIDTASMSAPDANDDAPPITPQQVTERLLEQLNRAAEQGLVDLAIPQPVPSDGPAAPIDIAEPDPTQYLQPIEEDLDGLAAMENRFLRELEQENLNGSITVRIPDTVSVLSRPGQLPEVPKLRAGMEEKQPDNCIDPDILDVRDWSDTRPAALQISELRGKVFGEFDIADPNAALDLVRLYIAHGFGLEAMTLIEDLKLTGQEVDVLNELAQLMEGMPHTPGGRLDRAAGCGGNNDMWRAAALGQLETQPVPDPDSIIDYFGETPILVRRLIGPRLISGFMERGQIDIANQLFAIIDRSAGAQPGPLKLVRARLLHTDGRIQEAEAAYVSLIQDGQVEAIEASLLLTESILSRGARVPDRLVQDLEALSYLYRGTDQGQRLRVGEITAKAGSQRLSDALQVVYQETNGTLTSSPDIAAATNAILKSATVDKYGLGGLTEAIFSFDTLVRDPAISADARLHLAGQILSAGLPNAVSRLLEPEAATATPAHKMLRARAALASEAPERVLAELADETDAEGRRLRAAALTKSGKYADAFDEIQPVASDREAQEFAWRAGNWDVAVKSERPEVRDLSEFMLRQQTPAVPDPVVLAEIGIPPDISNPLALPALDSEELSLAYARAVQDRSASVRAYLGQALTQF